MRPTAKEFWDRRAAVYDADAGVFYREAYEKTTACMRKYLKPTDTVLDFACGTGIVTLSLSPDVKELRGIDISNEMIRRAQGKAAAQGIANVLLTQTDLFDDSLAPASFDTVLACNVLLYVEQRAEVLARHPHAEAIGRREEHPARAQDILRAGFEIVEQEDLFPAPPNRFIAARKK